jgi:hypothetical protein
MMFAHPVRRYDPDIHDALTTCSWNVDRRTLPLHVDFRSHISPDERIDQSLHICCYWKYYGSFTVKGRDVVAESVLASRATRYT